jgi:DNA-binding MltR family transcriptional regulator
MRYKHRSELCMYPEAAVMAEAEEMVGRVAKAIYSEHVKLARADVEKIHLDHEGIRELVRKLKDESETAQILIFYSYLDDRIQHLMAQQMVGLESGHSRETLFGHSGPLGTFSNRTTVAYHLGWLSPKHCVRLNAFRKVRNEFAHHAFKVSMTDSHIADKLKLIDYDIKAVLGPMYSADEHDLDHFNTLLPRIIYLAFRTFEELIVLPTAKTHRVHPKDIAPSFDDRPALLRALSISMASALIVAGVKKVPPLTPHAATTTTL